jgi:hypothetical protein
MTQEQKEDNTPVKYFYAAFVTKEDYDNFKKLWWRKGLIFGLALSLLILLTYL